MSARNGLARDAMTCHLAQEWEQLDPAPKKRRIKFSHAMRNSVTHGDSEGIDTSPSYPSRAAVVRPKFQAFCPIQIFQDFVDGYSRASRPMEVLPAWWLTKRTA